MKTKLNFAVILFIMISIIPTGRIVSATTTGKDTLALNTISVSLPVVEEEGYVDDIPFDTRAMALNSLFMNLMQPEDEAYVNDIPYDTEEVYAYYKSSSLLLSFTPEEEAYIDDIPFDTAQIVEEYYTNLNNMATRTHSHECDDL